MIYDEEHYNQVLAVARSYRNDVERLETKISDMEAKLAEMTKKYELASCPTGGLVDRVRNLEQQLDEKDKEIEQLKNAIVPKFKIGQEVFYIVDKYKLKSGEILEIQIWDLKKDNIVYVIEYGGNVWCENELFATKAEAEAKLEELKGEKDE